MGVEPGNYLGPERRVRLPADENRQMLEPEADPTETIPLDLPQGIDQRQHEVLSVTAR